jgi:uncharacterized protein YggT (Ycf19 family)
MTQDQTPPPVQPSQVNVNAPGTPVPPATPRSTTGWTIHRTVMLIFGIIFVLIGLRVLLLLLGANAGNGIVDFIYGITEPMVAPFRGIFSINHVSPTGKSVIDIAALVAIVGWVLIGILIDAILRIANREPAA